MCIPIFWYCDGKTHCPEGSDELNCACDKYGMVQCKTDWNISICIPPNWICTGYFQCLEYNPTHFCFSDAQSAAKCVTGDVLCQKRQKCIQKKSGCRETSDCFKSFNICSGKICCTAKTMF